jgi:hypothetical protein
MLLGLFTSGIQALVFAVSRSLYWWSTWRSPLTRSTFKWEHMESLLFRFNCRNKALVL